MDLQVSLKKILKKGILTSELEFERASVIDRKLRLLVKEFPELNEERKQLRALLNSYEDKHWVTAEITDRKVEESERAAQIAEDECVFLTNRKNLIKAKLKEFGLTQKDLGFILGHTSATYVSELINGINPFTLNDLIVIHSMLNIELECLIPTIIPKQVQVRISDTLLNMKNPKLISKAESLFSN